MHPNFKRAEDKRRALKAKGIANKTLTFKFADLSEKEVDNTEISMHTDMDFYTKLEVKILELGQGQSYRLLYNLDPGKT